MRPHFIDPTNTLSARTMNTLGAFGLFTADQVRKVLGHGLAKRPPNLGKKSLTEIENWLNKSHPTARIEPTQKKEGVMRRDDDKHFWYANRLQHLATRALKKSHRYPSLSGQAEHHFRRYLKLLLLTTQAWQKVSINAPRPHPLQRESA